MSSIQEHQTPPPSTTSSLERRQQQQHQSPLISFKTAAAILLLSILALSALRTFFPRAVPLSTTSTSTTRTMATVANGNSTSKLQIQPRPWNARGHADHDWLYTYHTFSFANYYDPKFPGFGPLRVINEDRVRRGTGFGTHGHKEFLIWSYIVSGELEHRDSMGNVERLRRGEVQFTSAGTGIRHSEYNRNEQEDVHFLQIWSKPDVSGLKPEYITREFTDEMKKDTLLRVMESTKRSDSTSSSSNTTTAPDPIPMHADLTMYASILSPGSSVTHSPVADGERNLYLHVVMTDRKQPKEGGARIKIGGEVEIGEGDGAFVKGARGPDGALKVESVGTKEAEFLLFDMGLD